MKVPPKRKGNSAPIQGAAGYGALNESPSEKEGKSVPVGLLTPLGTLALNESPSEKEGKSLHGERLPLRDHPLNESPSEKEGKSGAGVVGTENTPNPQ